MLFPSTGGAAGLERAMEELCRNASAAVASGHTLLVLSDRGVNSENAPIPSLLATAGVHHHLVREGTRTKCSLIIESGEAREVHHMALLVGYGAAAINPYLAFEIIEDLILQREVNKRDVGEGIRRYIKACTKGILKVMSKMGISTLQGYRGAQTFEAVGLDGQFVEKYFTWTASRIGGIGIETVTDEVTRRHAKAFPQRGRKDDELESGGEYQWRRDGEYHLFNPETVFKLQHATRSDQVEVYREYAAQVNDQSRRLATLRGLLSFKSTRPAIPLTEVEPV
jgi:glutamate synthase (ferredoxin)